MSRPRRKSEFVKVHRILLETIEKSWRIPPPSRGYTPMSDLGKEMISNGLEQLRELLNPSSARDDLAQALARAEYWKQRAKSAEGHLLASDLQAACDAVHKVSNYADIPQAELSVRQKAHVSQVVHAVLASINARRVARRPNEPDVTDFRDSQNLTRQASNHSDN